MLDDTMIAERMFRAFDRDRDRQVSPVLMHISVVCRFYTSMVHVFEFAFTCV